MKHYPAEGTAPPTAGVPHLYYTDAIGGHDLFGRDARFSVVVDISEQIERKTEALAAHDSQRSWLRTQHGLDSYIDSMRDWGARRGELAGVAFAEAFQQHLGHPHPQNDLLTELFSG